MEQEVIAQAAEMGTVAMAIYLTLLIINIIGYWKIHTKAGQPGWAMFIPIYNVIVWLNICQRPLWWFILLLIPFVNVVVAFMLVFDIARLFNHSVMFAFGLIFLPFIFYPVLGLGNSRYVG